MDGNDDVMVTFRCNICGSETSMLKKAISREAGLCPQCHSVARLRNIIDAVSLCLHGEHLCLPDFPVRKDLVGIGMSDAPLYATPLAEKFDYRNTYFGKEPHLDILNLPANLFMSADFIISTDVLEHVVPPVGHAFSNLFKLLKPGGWLIFSVPYHPDNERGSIEHFPNLYDFTIVEQADKCYLVNKRRDGAVEVFDKVVFHGAPEGRAAEMRMMCEADVLLQLRAAGFTEIEIDADGYMPFGIYWPQPWARVVVARRPLS